MFDNLSKLIYEGRSIYAESWLIYLKTLSEEMQQNTLLNRFGRSWEKNNLRIPLQVVPYKPSGRDLESLNPPQNKGEDDTEISKEKTYPPEPLDMVVKQLTFGLLLGDPGAGKSEYLRHIVQKSAAEQYYQLYNFNIVPEDLVLPIFLRLSELGTCLFKGENADANAKEFLKSKGISINGELGESGRLAAAILKALLQQKFPENLASHAWQLIKPRNQAISSPKQATAIIALDAWDEARGHIETFRPLISEYVKHSPARVFVTSRLIDYGNFAMSVETDDVRGNRRNLKVVPFTRLESEEFIRNFFAFEADGKSLADKLLPELKQKPSMQKMAESPLLLTLLAVCFTSSPDSAPIGLPARRVDVYERVIEIFLSDVQNEKTKTDKNADLQSAENRRITLDVTEKRTIIKLLEEIAYEFFPNENSTDFEIKSEKLVEFILEQVEDNKSLAGLEEKLAKKDRNLVNILTETGILKVSSQSPVHYTFLHFTFQEYLLAVAFSKRLEPKVKKDRWLDDKIETVTNLTREKILAQHKLWKTIDLEAWHPYWQEVIIMLAGRLKNPLPLLVLLADEDTDDYFRHRLALASLCLPEALKPKMDNEIKCKLERKIDEITNEAFWFWVEYSKINREKVIKIMTKALPALGQANGKIIFHNQQKPLIVLLQELFLETLKKEKETFGSYYRDNWILTAINRIGILAVTDEIQNTLSEMLKSEIYQKRQSAAYILMKIGAMAVTDKILETIANMLQNGDDNVSELAVETLGVIGAAAATDEFLKTLGEMLRSDKVNLRRTALRALDSTPSLPFSGAFEEEFAQIEDVMSQIPRLRRRGIGTAAAKSEFLKTLGEMLRSNNVNLRETAVLAVKAIRGETVATDEILKTLFEMLQNEAFYLLESGVFYFLDNVVMALVYMGPAIATDESTKTLTKMLHSDNPNVRQSAVKILRYNGATIVTDEMRKTLAEMLHSNDLYWTALEALRNIGATAVTNEILKTLAGMLQSDDDKLHRKVAEFLSEIGAAAATDEVKQVLPKLLKSEVWAVRQSAEIILRGIGADIITDEIRNTLAEMLKIDNLRGSAVYILEKIGADAVTDEMRKTLAVMLRSDNHEIRHLGINALRGIRFAAATGEFLETLAEMLRSDNDYERETGLSAVCLIGATAATDKVLEILTKMLRSDNNNVLYFAANVLIRIGAIQASDEIREEIVSNVVEMNL